MATRTTTRGSGGKTAKSSPNPKKKSQSAAAASRSSASSRGAKKKRRADSSGGEGGGLFGRLCWAALFVALTWASCEVASLPSSQAIAALGGRFPQKTSLMRTREREAARRGAPLELIHKPVAFEAMSPLLVQALVASEDARFFQHEGVDWREVQAAVKQSAETGARLRGASTLTQQLAKNLFLSERRSPLRKLKELWITRALESAHSKERLLALYLNSVEWGDGVFGAEAAAEVWFGKTARTVSLGEAAALVAMLPNPRRIGPSAHEEWQKRTDRVLRRLTAEGKVTRQAAAQAAGELARMVF